MSLDRKVAAEKIRFLLEGRLARLLGCEPSELSHMKIGTLAHFLFLLVGDSEVMPGFNTAMSALRLLVTVPCTDQPSSVLSVLRSFVMREPGQ